MKKTRIFTVLVCLIVLMGSWTPQNNRFCGCKSQDNNLAFTASKITVTVTGGANAGTYTINSEKATCSRGLTGATSFGNQYSKKTKDSKEFASLQLIADNYDLAKKGTDKFYVKVGFGPLVTQSIYEINQSTNNFTPIKKSGKGKLTLSENANNKTVAIEGEDKNGVKLKIKLECFKILQMKNNVLIEE